jgi:ligand-binding sensor domain-containing protein
MRRNLSKIVITVLLISVSLIAVSADYTFERLSIPVSHSNIITINQDKQGFMWFGTRNGLNRYDGVNMVAFHHHSFDSTTLINNLVNSINIGKNGLLWVGTYDGLSLFDPEQFKFGDINHFFELNNKPVFGNILSIDNGIDNEVWVGTLSNGLYLFDTKLKKTVSFRSDKNNGGLCSDLINVVKYDSKGRVWAGTRNCLSLIEKN